MGRDKVSIVARTLWVEAYPRFLCHQGLIGRGGPSFLTRTLVVGALS